MSGQPNVTPEQLAQICAELRKHRRLTFTEACRAAGIAAATMRHRIERVMPRFASERPDLDFSLPAFGERTSALSSADPEAAELKQQLREANAKLASYDKTHADAKWIKEQLYKLVEETVVQPDWLVKAKADGKSPGIPEMIWSDWHWGEVVRREQLNGVNEYDLDIAHKRAHRLVERTIMLLRQYMVHPKYEGIVLNLGGDMLSGIIHEELVNTNAKPIMAAVVDLWGVLEWAIGEMANEFGKIVIFCVPGNHGRSTKKMPSKDAAETSFDWLVYMHLQHAFRKDKRVTVIAPLSSDHLYAVYGHRRLLTHGNQFRGGDGIIGSIGPVTRGRQKKHSRNAEIGQGFSTMIHGHFHTYSPGDRIIGNGSLIGYNQYASDNNFGIEDPKQAMWITHPQHGITFHVPVFVDEKPRDTKAASISWVEVQ
jgi:hypothetical protein